jgi:hypothetical protein
VAGLGDGGVVGARAWDIVVRVLLVGWLTGLLASCSETPLGPSISGRDPASATTDTSGGVVSGGQPDDDVADDDTDTGTESVTDTDTDTTTDTDTGTGTGTGTDPTATLTCSETSTQNV